MFGSNAHYGHRSILNAYASVADGTPIPGLLQHGWNYDLGATLDDIRLPDPDPFFVWSDRNLRQCRRAGIGHRVVPLGSPFLYMPSGGEDPPLPVEKGALLVVPIHGWEQERVVHDFEEYARQTAELAGDFAKIRVCLYWHEHKSPELRAPFERRGFEVVTAGHRDNNPRFLFELRSILARHEYVCSNRLQTAAFYALHLGCKFFLHGPMMGLDGRFDHSGQLFDAWQRREYPHLTWEGFRDTCHRDVAEYELGQPHLRTPEALRELLLWEPALADRLDAKRRARGRRIGEERKEAQWNARADRVRAAVGRWRDLLGGRDSARVRDVERSP